MLRRPDGNHPFDETAPVNDRSTNAYFLSKVTAEQAIAEWLQSPTVKAQEVRLVQILPGGWGPETLRRPGSARW